MDSVVPRWAFTILLKKKNVCLSANTQPFLSGRAPTQSWGAFLQPFTGILH